MLLGHWSLWLLSCLRAWNSCKVEMFYIFLILANIRVVKGQFCVLYKLQAMNFIKPSIEPYTKMLVRSLLANISNTFVLS